MILLKQRMILAILFIINIVGCKSVDFKESHSSLDIDESKKRNVFISEYRIEREKMKEDIEFKYNQIWLEKCWSNYLDKNGNEKWNISDSCAHLIINLKNPDYFFNNIYWNKIEFKDSTGRYFGSGRGILFFYGKKLVDKPNSFKIIVFKVQNEDATNLDNDIIGEILLKIKN